MIEAPPQEMEVFGVRHTLDTPSISEKTSRHILRESQTGVSLDGDVVVVIDPTQIRQLQMTRQRSRLSADALHHAPVTRQRVYVIVKKSKVGPVVALGQPFAGQCDAHAGSHSLAQRARCGFYARRPTVFGVAGAFAFELAKFFEVLQGN